MTTAGDVDVRSLTAVDLTAVDLVDDGPAPRLRYADGALDPASWCAAVTAAVQRITAGDLAKVVLARDLLVSADAPLDPRRLLRRLAARFPDCWTFAVDGLLGATPELLLRKTGRELSARVLAGTAPRGAGAEDERLAAELIGSAKDRAEHELAVDSLVRALDPYCTRLTVPAEPSLLTLANVRHLASDVGGTQRRSGARGRAELLELIGAVHPTAAVCGTPTEDAAALIGAARGHGPGALRGSGGLARRPRERRVRSRAAVRGAQRHERRPAVRRLRHRRRVRPGRGAGRDPVEVRRVPGGSRGLSGSRAVAHLVPGGQTEG